jgi:hypothetical protein
MVKKQEQKNHIEAFGRFASGYLSGLGVLSVGLGDVPSEERQLKPTTRFKFVKKGKLFKRVRVVSKQPFKTQIVPSRIAQPAERLTGFATPVRSPFGQRDGFGRLGGFAEVLDPRLKRLRR